MFGKLRSAAGGKREPMNKNMVARAGPGIWAEVPPIASRGSPSQALERPGGHHSPTSTPRHIWVGHRGQFL